MSVRKAADYAKEVYREGELQYKSKGEKVRLQKILSLVASNNKLEFTQIF